MKTELKNKVKIAVIATVLLAGMITYKLVYDKRKQDEKSKKEKDD